MPNLDYTFDEYTEEYCARQLREIRAFARETDLPARVSLEIGTNRGRFLAGLYHRWPDRRFLGVEMRFKYVEQARGKIAELDGADVLCADANLVIPVVFDEEQIAEVFLMYPDPWWKKRHRKRRVIQPDFLDMIAPKMMPGAPFWIRTDVGPLADDMRDIFVDHPAFEPLPFDEYPGEGFPRSTREQTVIDAGIPVNLVYFRRR